MNGKVTQEEINKVVWQACDTFRGVIDPSQYKDYILTMLFLKYVSDVSKAKYKEYLQRYDGDTERAQRAMRRERSRFPRRVRSTTSSSTATNPISASSLMLAWRTLNTKTAKS